MIFTFLRKLFPGGGIRGFVPLDSPWKLWGVGWLTQPLGLLQRQNHEGHCQHSSLPRCKSKQVTGSPVTRLVRLSWENRGWRCQPEWKWHRNTQSAKKIWKNIFCFLDSWVELDIYILLMVQQSHTCWDGSSPIIFVWVSYIPGVSRRILSNNTSSICLHQHRIIQSLQLSSGSPTYQWRKKVVQ